MDGNKLAMNALTDTQKLEAIKVFLTWDIKDIDVAIECLDQIWYVVMEDRFKPLDEIKKGN